MKQSINIIGGLLIQVLFMAGVFAMQTTNIETTGCASCHGQRGQGIVASYPKLAGQHKKYFVFQMLAFKSGQRENLTMQAIAAKMSLSEIEQLASYYASQAISNGLAEQKQIERGQQLFRYGDKKRGLPACMACHGPAGEGNTLAGIPMLAGQYTNYTQAQLVAYRAKQRSTDSNELMRSIAGQLSEQDIFAVANYISGLHRPH
jgi:cytochrome c553